MRADRQLLDEKLALLTQRASGDLGVAAFNLKTGEEVLLNADEIFPTASTIKVPVLVEVYRQIREGLVSREERIAMKAEDRVGGSGVLKTLDGGLNPTVRDLAMLMVIVSDNTATNMLIDRVGGKERVNQTIRDLGFDSIVLHNRVDFEILRHDARLFGETSPRDLGRLMTEMAQGQIVDPEISAEMLEIMRRQQYLDQAPRYLAFNPYVLDFDWIEEQPVSVACKTGFMRGGVRVDTGVISLPAEVEIAYCIATNGSTDASFGPEHEGQVVNGLVGRLLVGYWWEDENVPAPLIETPYLALLE